MRSILEVTLKRRRRPTTKSKATNNSSSGSMGFRPSAAKRDAPLGRTATGAFAGSLSQSTTTFVVAEASSMFEAQGLSAVVDPAACAKTI